ncbi:hypothetical protein MMC09_000125 [Bachmanniomyces sp. S44760]|nr:hypothetical protein [Bachmanniomyces sp. S44760]
MPTKYTLASLTVSETTSPSRTPTPTINTPPSTDSAQETSDPAISRPQQAPFIASRLRSRSPLQQPIPGSKRDTLRFSEGDYNLDPGVGSDEDDRFNGEDEDDRDDMPERPPMHRPTDGRSHQPLLKDERGRSEYETPRGSTRPLFHARRSTFRSRSPSYVDEAAATKRKYTYAAFFLVLSLPLPSSSYFTHGSWSLLWPVQLSILRLQKRRMPWKTFWKRHVQVLRSTALMVETQELHPHGPLAQRSPLPYILKTTAFVTTALTVAGGSWYVAVDLTSASDLTAIYNCSAFFAYAFSIPLLHDKLRFDKVFSVAVAIAGVLIVAYGDSGSNTKSPGHSGGASGGGPVAGDEDTPHRTLGNIVIGIGSVLYGLYEVLYKKLACPPEGTSPGRGMIFAMSFGSLIGCFTLFVLWIPLPILHVMGWETFELPHGEAAWMLLISVLANATFSGSFLVLISLTSPVLSSVAALLTIFLVAIVDWLLKGEPLSTAAILGGILIIVAFLLLSWSTYREMDEERRKRQADEYIAESDVDE